MVDIHSHILYGVDDGAKDLYESLELLKQAKSVGFTDIVCSSHYYIGRYENNNYDTNFEILQNKIEEYGIGVNIYKGNEFSLDINYSSHKNKIYRINNGRYLLIELTSQVIYPICKSFFESLLKEGVIPVFAHVERYPHLKIDELIELAKLGVILQMNLRMAANPIPRIEPLLNKGYIGVVATDSHNYGKRDYDVSRNLELLKKKVGNEYFELLTEIIPRKIINNEDIQVSRGERDEFKKDNGIRSFFSSLWSKLCRR